MPAEQIQASVGRTGINHYDDVMSVQTLVNMCLPDGFRPLAVDGFSVPKTEHAIEAIQKTLLRPDPPDGRVDPTGPTVRFLRRHAARHNHRNRLPSGGGPATPSAGAAPGRPPGAAPPAPAPASSRPAASPAAGSGKPGSVPPDIVAAAQAANREWHIPASITIAQWMVESGYGKHMPAGSNNPFGIKAASGQPYVEASTREEVHGQSVMMVQRFRKFDSIADAFDQHGKLLATAKPYARARSVLPNPQKFADALTGVYATDHTYGTMLKRQIAAHNSPSTTKSGGPPRRSDEVRRVACKSDELRRVLRRSDELRRAPPPAPRLTKRRTASVLRGQLVPFLGTRPQSYFSRSRKHPCRCAATGL